MNLSSIVKLQAKSKHFSNTLMGKLFNLPFPLIYLSAKRFCCTLRATNDANTNRFFALLSAPIIFSAGCQLCDTRNYRLKK